MIIAAAQTKPFANDTAANIRDHCSFIERAALDHARLIVFPEMSLTGYERELADVLSFTADDSRLDIFKQMSALHNMVIVAGAPVKMKDTLHIGAFIFSPNAPVAVYTKQFLHPGEEVFFTANADFNPLIKLDGKNISVAICADIAHPIHAFNAAKSNATIYLTGIFYTPDGITAAYEQLSSYAKQYAMNVLMANYCGSSYDLPSAGKTAFWDRSGALIGSRNEVDRGLLLAEHKDETWKVKLINVI